MAFHLLYAPTAANGNMLESNEIAQRHYVCGDPPNVSAQHGMHSAVVRGLCCSSVCSPWLNSERNVRLGLPQWFLNQLFTRDVETAVRPRSCAPCPLQGKSTNTQPNKYSTANRFWEPLTTYNKGQAIEMELLVTNHHLSLIHISEPTRPY